MKTLVRSIVFLSTAVACSRTGLDIEPDDDIGPGSGGLGISTREAGAVPRAGGSGTGGAGSGAGGAPVSVGGSSGVAGSLGQTSAADICNAGFLGGAAGTGGTSDDPPVQFCGTAGCIEGADVAMVTPRVVRCGGVECGAPKACCLRNLQCYDPRTEPEKCLPPDSGVEKAWGRPACASNAHCPRATFCQLDNQDWTAIASDQPPPLSCQGVGRCTPITNCGNYPQCPSCGCDGSRYPFQGDACLAGSNVGPCP